MKREEIIALVKKVEIGEVGQNHPKLHAFANAVAEYERNRIESMLLDINPIAAANLHSVIRLEGLAK